MLEAPGERPVPRRPQAEPPPGNLMELGPLDFLFGEAVLAADFITAWNAFGKAALAAKLITASPDSIQDAKRY